MVLWLCRFKGVCIMLSSLTEGVKISLSSCSIEYPSGKFYSLLFTVLRKYSSLACRIATKSMTEILVSCD